MFCKIVCVILLGSGVFAALHLPAEITKCKKTDSDCMGKTLVEALNFFGTDGNKEFGIPKLEPFRVEKLEIAADPGKSVKLQQKYEDVYMYGMVDATVKKFSLKDDATTCRWEIDVFTKRTRMAADYTLTGQVLLFPINGHGKCNVTLVGISNKHTADCERYTKKGKSYLRLKNYSMDMNVAECYFDFPNVIPGNEQISRELSKTINENSLEILKDVKGGFEHLFSRLYENGANSVFSKIPEDELFLS